MPNIKIYSNKGEWVGDINTEDSTYYTQRDFKRNQVFKYITGNPLAIDMPVVRQLAAKGVKFIVILVVGMDNSSFYAVSSLNFFIANSQKFYYKNHGEQRRMEIKLWKRAGRLDDVKKLRERENSELTNYIFNEAAIGNRKV